MCFIQQFLELICKNVGAKVSEPVIGERFLILTRGGMIDSLVRYSHHQSCDVLLQICLAT